MLIMEVIKSVSFVCRERVSREFLIHGSLECSPIFLYIYIFSIYIDWHDVMNKWNFYLHDLIQFVGFLYF